MTNIHISFNTRPRINKVLLSLFTLVALVALSIVLASPVAHAEDKAATNSEFSTKVSANTEARHTKIKQNHVKKPTIVALAPHIVELLFDIGAGDQIIGTTEFSDYPEQAKQIPRIGNYLRIQIERIIELQPDIIIAWQSGSPSDDLKKLSELGFTVVYSQPNNFADLAKEINYFAQLTGHEEQGLKVATTFTAELLEITQQYKNKSPVTVFYELWSQPLTTIANGSWPQLFLTTCQANNPFKAVSTPYPQVNIEQVLQYPIQLIIQPSSTNQSDKARYNWQDWSIISAVNHQQFIQPDADAMHRMTTRSLVTLKKLCQSIDNSRTYYKNNVN